MNSNVLLRRSRVYYQRYYVLISCVVLLMMAVLSGSLILGDSVRGTLVDRVNQRLGATQTVVTSGTGFLSDEIMQQEKLHFDKAYLMLQGFLSVQGKLLPVNVLGVDEDSLVAGSSLVNATLAACLQESKDELVLHLPSHTLVSSGTLFVTKSYGTKMRISVAGIKESSQGGDLSLRNDQTLPYNIFVNREELSALMGLEHKVNLLLSDEFYSLQQLASEWEPELSGIHVENNILTSDRIFLNEDVCSKVRPVATFYSYLVNDISVSTDTLPYSFVTALDNWKGRSLSGQSIILSDYAAQRLHVSEGDSVKMSYFMSQDLKKLEVSEQAFYVQEVVPLAEMESDSYLQAEFPGLSNVEKCTDWDSDLPIEMSRIDKEDEDFWYAHHQTPKALVSLDAVKDDWSNSYGVATALRLPDVHALSKLMPSDVGVVVVHPREGALHAATNGTDFAGLFLALGFFIMLSSILLLQNPLAEMFLQRSHELELYQHLGFQQKSIRTLLLRETSLVVLLASPFGVLLGAAYAQTSLWLLGTIWSGATNTTGFSLHCSVFTLFMSWFLGVIVAGAVLLCVICKATSSKNIVKKVAPLNGRRLLLSAMCVSILTVGVILGNFLLWHSVAMFVVAGLLWVMTFGMWLECMIDLYLQKDMHLSVTCVVARILHFSKSTVRLTYYSLSLGVFSVFAVGLNRPDFSDEAAFKQATGGYDAYVSCTVPIQYDLNDSAVRRKLLLEHLPDSTYFLQFNRHTLDEASCLNLNRVTTPTVLGVDLKAMADFGLEANGKAGVYADQESLLWSMMLQVGDSLRYADAKGDSVSVPIVGSYPTGILHGNVLMDRGQFQRLWPEEGGVSVFLVKSSNIEEASDIIATALNEYGLNIQTTKQRVQMFFEVTRTYLIIFLTLGGLGLLLGIFNLIVVVRKNLVASQWVIAQLSVLGFSKCQIRSLQLCQNVVVPFYAVVIGGIGSVISISANVVGAGALSLCLSGLYLILLLVCIYFGLRKIIYDYV